MPKLREESIGAGDQSWLGSMHAVENARTVRVNRTQLTPATHFPQGHLRSGQPLAIVSGRAVPYAASGTDGSQVLAGFLVRHETVPAQGDFSVALLDHGRVNLARVQALTGAIVAANASTSGQFVFV